MRVELRYVTPDAANVIGEYASICYDSKTDRDSNIKRAINCIDRGHLATLRFAHATFHVSGISRACSHQFVRSKHLDFLQRSQRYCKETEVEFVYPFMDKTCSEILDTHYKYCKSTYNALLKYGVKKEDARLVLPEGAQTELIVTGNFQAWKDFIILRAEKHAQWEIREVAVAINNLLAQATDNTIFKYYDNHS